MKQYIESHYPEYDTLTTLKVDAMNDYYRKRVKSEVNKISKMFLKEKESERE